MEWKCKDTIPRVLKNNATFFEANFMLSVNVIQKIPSTSTSNTTAQVVIVNYDIFQTVRRYQLSADIADIRANFSADALVELFKKFRSISSGYQIKCLPRIELPFCKTFYSSLSLVKYTYACFSIHKVLIHWALINIEYRLGKYLRRHKNKKQRP